MLPISAKTVIEFRPNTEAVAAAQAALAAAGDDSARAAAQTVLTAAEAGQGALDPVYRLLPPTGRTRILVTHAMASDRDAPPFVGGAELCDGVLEGLDPDGDDAAFLASVRGLVDTGRMLEEDAVRFTLLVFDTAAGRALHSSRATHMALLSRHRVRFCLLVPGRPNPLSESDLDSVPEADLPALIRKVNSLWVLSTDEAKNSDAPSSP